MYPLTRVSSNNGPKQFFMKRLGQMPFDFAVGDQNIKDYKDFLNLFTTLVGHYFQLTLGIFSTPNFYLKKCFNPFSAARQGFLKATVSRIH